MHLLFSIFLLSLCVLCLLIFTSDSCLSCCLCPRVLSLSVSNSHRPAPQAPGLSPPSNRNPNGISSCLLRQAVSSPRAQALSLLSATLPCIIAESCLPRPLQLLPSVALKYVYKRAQEKIYFCSVWFEIVGGVGSFWPLVSSPLSLSWPLWLWPSLWLSFQKWDAHV